MNAIGLYRLERFLWERRVPLLPKIVKAVIYLIFNSVVPYTAKIGKGTRFAYGGIGVVIHSRAEIGERVIIGQGVTIGRKISPNDCPVIGDDVYISAGSRVLGNIVVGSNVIIGANSVVVKDVPSNCIVAGAPARILRTIDVPISEMLENI